MSLLTGSSGVSGPGGISCNFSSLSASFSDALNSSFRTPWISCVPSGLSDMFLAEGFSHHGSHGSINLLSSPEAMALSKCFFSSADRSLKLISPPA